jgi:cell wall-associated NlpC family hydrolase
MGHRAAAAAAAAALASALAFATPSAAATATAAADQATPPNQAAQQPSAAPVHAASLERGLAVAPTEAPTQVQQMISAANRIARKPYVWGGGHASWRARGYDCSGSVSYILHAAGVLTRPLVSGQFAHFGQRGPGRWVTIYANATHVWMVIAGLRFDNGHAVPRGTSHWTSTPRSARGFKIRHIFGL